MSSFSNWVRIHWSRLRDLMWLIFVVGVSLLLLVFVFGTKAHRPHQYGSPIFWTGLHLSEWSDQIAPPPHARTGTIRRPDLAANSMISHFLVL